MEYLDRIKRLAKVQGISQKQLGDALGLQQGTMSRKLSGKYGIEVRELEKIASALQTTVGYLLTGQIDSEAQRTTTLNELNGQTRTYVPVINRRDFTSYTSGEKVSVISKKSLPEHLDGEGCLGIVVDNENIAQCAPMGSFALTSLKAKYKPKQPVLASVRGSEPDFYHMTQIADGVVFSTSQPDFPNLFVSHDEYQIHGYIVQSEWHFEQLS
ncbi:helix-turn-helix domain-containing protein [Thaumasiovibrio subtropicus]|uniref:helix-turn-helix domain-containing protein n=1 Tax=Thaumasiovibrio subtropicus TaxID=1891207 RepID=UPI000B34D433|nr:helix-turn-helix transcriptional regulator [Thaumasiovibrio subtropicus]